MPGWLHTNKMFITYSETGMDLLDYDCSALFAARLITMNMLSSHNAILNPLTSPLPKGSTTILTNPVTNAHCKAPTITAPKWSGKAKFSPASVGVKATRPEPPKSNSKPQYSTTTPRNRVLRPCSLFMIKGFQDDHFALSRICGAARLTLSLTIISVPPVL